jgi:hypothetical protein
VPNIHESYIRDSSIALKPAQYALFNEARNQPPCAILRCDSSPPTVRAVYEFFKDFAGPIATLVAASVATFITIAFARAQARIAQSQRDIALDKLKFDLLQRRYEIYQAAKELLEYMPFVHDIEKSDSNKIRTLYVKMDEARFYFPPSICSLLDNIRRYCEEFFVHLAKRDRLNIDDREAWSAMAELLAADQATLRQIYAKLPETFETALKFEQLTTSSSTSYQ